LDAHFGPKSDIAALPKSANKRLMHRSKVTQLAAPVAAPRDYAWLLSDPRGRMLSASGTMESSMSKAGLDNRHRNRDGEISHKHGNTLIRTLRKIYGQGFAAGYPETEKLSEVLLQLNETSMSQLRRDYETGHLEHKIVKASK
jgi:hypothetical protein